VPLDGDEVLNLSQELRDRVSLCLEAASPVLFDDVVHEMIQMVVFNVGEVSRHTDTQTDAYTRTWFGCVSCQVTDNSIPPLTTPVATTTPGVPGV
jgi:hypothetical protein